MGVVAHVKVEPDYVIEDDSPLLVDRVVLDPVLLLCFQSLLHLNFLGCPLLDVDHQRRDSLDRLAEVLLVLLEEGARLHELLLLEEVGLGLGDLVSPVLNLDDVLLPLEAIG